MKTIISLFVLFTSFLSFSQDEIKIGYFYIFTDNIRIIELQASEIAVMRENRMEIDDYKKRFKIESAKKEFVEMKAGWMFQVTNKKEGQFYVVKIIKRAGYENRIFGLTEMEILNYTQEYKGDMPKRSFVTSAVTIPIKIRPGDGESGENKQRYFDFEGNVNIGLSAGFRDRVSKNGKSYMSYIGGISIGSTKITPETVSTDLTSETNASTLTPFVGAIYEYNDFQIGIFAGWDHLGGKLGKSWIYQGKTWIGIGLGYNIFTTKDQDP